MLINTVTVTLLWITHNNLMIFMNHYIAVNIPLGSMHESYHWTAHQWNQYPFIIPVIPYAVVSLTILEALEACFQANF